MLSALGIFIDTLRGDEGDGLRKIQISTRIFVVVYALAIPVIMMVGLATGFGWTLFVGSWLLALTYYELATRHDPTKLWPWWAHVVVLAILWAGALALLVLAIHTDLTTVSGAHYHGPE